MALTVLFSYDIVENRKRAKCAALLQTVANRIQDSVYIGVLEQKTLDEVVAAVKKIINLETDTLLISKLCSNCWEKHLEIGQAKISTNEVCYCIF